jgi:ATP-dependent DNA helicase DinG
MTDLQPFAHIDEHACAELLAPGGLLSNMLPNHEPRPAQQTLAGNVAHALNQGEVLCAEAPTGVGKSLAYLLPAARWALANECRVVVSTNTINLQRQLADRDLPLVQTLLHAEDPETELVFSELVGRSNYLCPWRLEHARLEVSAGRALFDDEGEQLDMLLDWFNRVKGPGRRQDLDGNVSMTVWSQANADADNCLNQRCSHYDRCPFFRSRRQAGKAQILLVNHALLLADISQRQGDFSGPGVLPKWDAAILDEGHHVEVAATRAFTVEVSRRSLSRQLDRLRHPRNEGIGDLPRLDMALGGVEGAYEKVAHALSERLIEGVDAWVPTVISCADRLWDSLEVHYGEEQYARQVWIDAGRAQAPDWQSQGPLIEDLRRALGRLLGQGKSVLDQLDQTTLAEDEDAVRDAALAFGSRLHRLGQVAEALGQIAAMPEDGCVWTSVGAPQSERNRRRFAGLYCAPVDVAELLHNWLFEPAHAVVLTSATLADDRGFKLLTERTGIDRLLAPPRLLALPSPFDHRAQSMLGSIPDMPDPRDRQSGAHTAALISAVDQLARASNGDALILFTAISTMRQVFDATASSLRRAGLEPMIQDRNGPSRAELLRRFQTTAGGVLFATDSFWEGVDVPGDALRLVVITRLPFRVPNEPLQQARHARIEAEGGRPFFELTLPEAILRLRQGFGRLIRHRTDRGAVVVLDPRLDTARYGRRFVQALPPARRVRGPMHVVVEAVREVTVGTPRPEQSQ